MDECMDELVAFAIGWPAQGKPLLLVTSDGCVGACELTDAFLDGDSDLESLLEAISDWGHAPSPIAPVGWRFVVAYQRGERWMHVDELLLIDPHLFDAVSDARH